MSEVIEEEVNSGLNQIQNKYTFWFRGGSGNAAKVQGNNYQESIKKVSSFQTVEDFWTIYDHLKRPHEFRVTTEYHLFKEGITPTWEDPQNKLGGKWMVRLKKGIASRYWEDVVLAIIGEQFDVGPEICGAVISVRNNEDIISIWNKTADNAEAVNKIRDQLRRIWKLPAIIAIEYKRHQDSLVDKSSYRNPSLVWKAPTKSSNPNGQDKMPAYVPKTATEKLSSAIGHRDGQQRDGQREGQRDGYRENSTSGRSDHHGPHGASHGGSSTAAYPKVAWKPTRATEPVKEASKPAWGAASERSPNLGGGNQDKTENKVASTSAPKDTGGWQRGVGVVTKPKDQE